MQLTTACSYSSKKNSTPLALVNTSLHMNIPPQRHPYTHKKKGVRLKIFSVNHRKKVSSQTGLYSETFFKKMKEVGLELWLRGYKWTVYAAYWA